MFSWEKDIVIRQGASDGPPGGGRKRGFEDIAEPGSADEARYSPRPRAELAEDKGKAKMNDEDFHDMLAKRERQIAENLGVVVDDDWEGLGSYLGGWRMDD